MYQEDEILKGCKELNNAAQSALYKKYAAKMNAVCLRYISSKDEAKDILQEGFIKVFANIHKFKGEGSLEGWIRRIVVNTAIYYLKKNKAYLFESIDHIVDIDNNNES